MTGDEVVLASTSDEMGEKHFTISDKSLTFESLVYKTLYKHAFSIAIRWTFTHIWVCIDTNVF